MRKLFTSLQELLERKLEIDANEDKDTGLEARFYKTDDDCIRAGELFSFLTKIGFLVFFKIFSL